MKSDFAIGLSKKGKKKEPQWQEEKPKNMKEMTRLYITHHKLLKRSNFLELEHPILQNHKYTFFQIEKTTRTAELT